MHARESSIKAILAAAASALLLASCGQGAQGPPNIHSVNTASYGTLEFAVGTANVFGTTSGLNVVSSFRQTAATTPAKSAVLVSTPTISGPFSLATDMTGNGLVPGCAGKNGADAFNTAIVDGACGSSAPGGYVGPGAVDGVTALPNSGPSVTDVNSNVIGSTSQAVPVVALVCDQIAPCTASGNGVSSGTEDPNTSTFGESGGVFSSGLMPGNATDQGGVGSYTPYTAPLYLTAADVAVGNIGTSGTISSTNPALPWGGPPAYDPDGNGMGVRDGLNDLGAVQGVAEGITAFAHVAPAAGTYTLSVVVPTSTASTVTLTKTATLAAPALLPALTPPVMAEDGTGGGTFTVVLPAGVTEEIIQVADYGPASAGDPAGAPNCQGTYGVGLGVGPVWYTIVAHASGTVTLPDTDGPNLDYGGGPKAFAPSPTLCSATANATEDTANATTGGDIYTVQVYGADYPLYESSPLFGSSAPTLTGANGQADITISPIAYYQYGNPGFVPADLKRFKPFYHFKPIVRSASKVKTIIR
jgi:hypothetical protein